MTIKLVEGRKFSLLLARFLAPQFPRLTGLELQVMLLCLIVPHLALLWRRRRRHPQDLFILVRSPRPQPPPRLQLLPSNHVHPLKVLFFSHLPLSVALTWIFR